MLRVSFVYFTLQSDSCLIQTERSTQFCIRRLVRSETGGTSLSIPNLSIGSRSAAGTSFALANYACDKHTRRLSMGLVLRKYINIQEGRLARGQTMTEYALILAAIAVVVF